MVTDISMVECEPLATFYRSTDGDNWKRNSGWLTTATPCSWEGVTCGDGHVRALGLEENRLGGSIPAELGNLENLETLGLAGNQQLSGSIPPEPCGLTSLEIHIEDAQVEPCEYVRAGS